ncbi:MAG: NAD(P)/FAD-dependent oxidoreductase [Polyangiaceae bacterium]
MQAPSVLILGSGFAGLGMAIALSKAGHRSFTLLEKAERVGGTWRDNTYPGAACDVPSHLYSYSFEPNPRWSRRYSGQPEIQSYLEHCAKKYGILPRVRTGVEVTQARFDESKSRWRITTRSGDEHEAQVLVLGAGQLSQPVIPRIPGAESFAGPAFHSARWDHAADLRQKNVAVIGSGASAIQIVPELAKVAKKLSVFQRTAPYVLPRRDYAYSPVARAVFERFPAVARAYRAYIYLSLEARFFAFSKQSWLAEALTRVASWHRERVVTDPELRAKLTPDYPLGCKRILLSDDYYPALVRDNVELVTEPIAGIEPGAVLTRDGQKHPVDALIYATGFDSKSFLGNVEIRGRGASSLSETWAKGAEAYLGMNVPGFPNLFVLYGPNTNLGHNSIVFMLERQIGWVMACLEELGRQRAAAIEVTSEALGEFNRELEAELEKRVWASGCTSWYVNDAGKNENNWSGFTLEYWWRTRRPDFSAYSLTRA